MKNSGLVSVILPVYNRESTIKRAIDSVLRQTYSKLELIVIDDASSDNTVKLVNEYTDERIRLICQEQNGGACKARNVGIANARGEYIAFQDSDDEWLEDKLDTQIKIMKEKKCPACYSAYYLYDNDSVYFQPIDFENQSKYEAGLGKILAEYNVIGTVTLIIKYEVLKLFNDEYFDEQLPRLQDYEFVIRLFKVCPIAYVNRPLVNAFHTEISITANSGAFYAASARIMEKHGDFLNENRFIDAMINAEQGISAPLKFVNAVNEFQEQTGFQDAKFKDRMMVHMAEKINIQNELLYRQFQWAVHHLRDKEFSIYGAGNMGCEVYRFLLRKNLHPACFLVTKCEEKKFINDIPIYSIDEWKDRDNMVIISIAKEHQIELIDNLITRQYKQFCIYSKRA